MEYLHHHTYLFNHYSTYSDLERKTIANMPEDRKVGNKKYWSNAELEAKTWEDQKMLCNFRNDICLLTTSNSCHPLLRKKHSMSRSSNKNMLEF